MENLSLIPERRVQSNANKLMCTEQTSELEIPNIGVGTMVTTATSIATLLHLEDSTVRRMEVLSSVLDHLGVKPEDLIKFRNNSRKWEMLDYDNDETYSFEKK